MNALARVAVAAGLSAALAAWLLRRANDRSRRAARTAPAPTPAPSSAARAEAVDDDDTGPDTDEAMRMQDA